MHAMTSEMKHNFDCQKFYNAIAFHLKKIIAQKWDKNETFALHNHPSTNTFVPLIYYTFTPLFIQTNELFVVVSQHL